jgi:uncharacterized membrane protein YkoI
VNAQDLSADKVPTKVMADFQKNYPQAKDVEWEMQGNHYKVDFDLGRYDHEISYDNAGKVVKLEKEINPTELPSNIASVVKQKYPDYKIDKVEVKEWDNKTSYEVEIEQGWFKERNLVLDSNGKLISDLED